MNTATYSLLTLRPNPDRIDVLCVGAVVLDTNGDWHVSAPGPESKLSVFGAAPDILSRMSTNLKLILINCSSLEQARKKLQGMRSSLALHDFEGVFSYSDSAEFSLHLREILNESVIPFVIAPDVAVEKTAKIVRPRTRARLRKQFETMGILANKAEGIDDHKVVHNFPVSLKHGLKAEFALKNSVMHITETIDFDVSEDSVRAKTFEAQAKCLVLHAARDEFGDATKRHIVVSGSAVAHAARTVDLLSTVGDLYATENSSEMDTYISIIARAAGMPVITKR
jgi:hypothetical protein